MDILIQTSNYIYIIECKLDGSAEEALQQIEAKNYAAPFAMDKRKVITLGINFSNKTRGVEQWIIEWEEVASNKKLINNKYFPIIWKAT